MRHWLLLLIAAVVVAGIAYTVVWIFTGGEEGLAPSEPDGRAVPLPGTRPLAEGDIVAARFDTALRGYRMAQVDAALRRTAYDIGYKQELIDVLEAEVEALRAGRRSDADRLRAARLSALAGTDTSSRGGRHTAADADEDEPALADVGYDPGEPAVYAVDGYAADEPDVDEPAADGPAADGPAADGPAADKALADGPAVDEADTDEAGTDGGGGEGAESAGGGDVDADTAGADPRVSARDGGDLTDEQDSPDVGALADVDEESPVHKAASGR